MQIVAEPCCTSGTLTAVDLLPADLYDAVRRTFSSADVEYIARVLLPGELRVIDDLHDALIIAKIKCMPEAELRRFDNLVPLDNQQCRFYHDIQVKWLRVEAYLLGTVLGRSPRHDELFFDFMNNKNGQRFRAYFAIKYPERMRDKHAPLPTHATV